MDVKKREVLVGAIIAFVMLTAGIAISGSLSENAQKSVEKYTTAVRIEDEEQFSYGMTTGVGNALVYGTLQAAHPVTYPELGNEYMAVCKVKERYTMHTRTYTTTDSNGHTQIHTETYWSWDYVGEEQKISDTVLFMGKEFRPGQFELPAQERVYLSDGSSYLKESSTVRYYYTALPTAFDATIHADLRDDDIGQRVAVFQNSTPETVVDRQIRGRNTPIIVFWVLWVVLMAGVLIVFVKLENRWLDD